MMLSIWRYAHLVLAVIASIFLFILSVTGVILAVDAVFQKTDTYRVDHFDSLNLAQTVTALRKVYPEITQIEVDHFNRVILEATDGDGNEIRGYVDPNNGRFLGKVKSDQAFMNWVKSLHRSLFLHETGRIIVGVVAFLLFLITTSGIILTVKRQQGIKRFFSKVNNDFFSSYYHVVTGRIFILPILVISLTGTYLLLMRLDLLPKKSHNVVQITAPKENLSTVALADFPIFKETKLAELKKLEFPFIEDDPEETFSMKTKRGSFVINQIDGHLISQERFTNAVVWERLVLDIHTGKIHPVWAIILAIAALNILMFIYTGFDITFRRSRSKVKNSFSAQEAEIVLLVGSENGTTLGFANHIQNQLLADGKKVFLAQLNQYQAYPAAQHLLIFTSTYGLGNPPSNAGKFEELLQIVPQHHQINYSVVGFGSKSYPDFCAYAYHLADLLSQKSYFSEFIPIHTINDKSTDDFVEWVHAWSEKSCISLATAASVYSPKKVRFEEFKVVEKTRVTEENSTFTIVLKPLSKIKFESGDLLSIFPNEDHQERFYSIGKVNNDIQLVVKLHENGIGSGYLYRLEPGQKLKARLMANPNFHFPKKASAVMLIANGTGIAPFLGMISSNKQQIPVHLYTGFRYDNSMAKNFRKKAEQQMKEKHLMSYSTAFSREQNPQYVMDLIQRDALKFLTVLQSDGCIMICGSLAMQKDVEEVLEKLVYIHLKKELSYFKNKGQVLADCY